jgi:integrase
MPLEIQLGRSKWFYARLEVDGKKVFQNLNVEIEGKPPCSLRDEGDSAFERSRARATVALEKLKADLSGSANAEEICQKILQIRTGTRMGTIQLKHMANSWRDLPRKRTIDARYCAQSIEQLDRFARFVLKEYPSVAEMANVQSSVAKAFMKTEENRGVGPKTYNDTLKLLSSCFTRLKKDAGVGENPFDGIPTKENDTIHRKPFSEQEVDAIIDASKSDSFIQSLIVVAVCTAMRLGDCANLTWEHVDLASGFIDVKTAKTRKLVTIPIFPMLQDLLCSLPGTREGYVFPELAEQYAASTDVLTDRVRAVMRKVGFGNADDGIETGQPLRGAFHQVRMVGLRRASIRDIQSFRVTWVTLALNAGVPVDLVQRVTGHQTVDIVQKHYHQPGRDDFKRALEDKLPNALTGRRGHAAITLETVRSKLGAMTPNNWQGIRDELIAALGGGPV